MLSQIYLAKVHFKYIQPTRIQITSCDLTYFTFELERKIDKEKKLRDILFSKIRSPRIRMYSDVSVTRQCLKMNPQSKQISLAGGQKGEN